MTGVISLQGGGAFTANDELDAALLAEVGATEVVVLPTADAFEQPDRLVETARAWGARLGVAVQPLMVLGRSDALETSAADTVRGARAVMLVGDSPFHLRSVLKDTPVWHALESLLASGGLVTAVGMSAAAVCDPMFDPRGGAFTIGLGMVGGLAIVPESETWSHDALHRTLKLATTTVAVLPTRSALVRRATGWSTVGDAEVHGPLPA